MEHLDKVRKIPGLEECYFVIMPESNLALTTSNIVDSLKTKLTPDEYYIINEDKGEKGFRTDNGLKAIGTHVLKNIIEYNHLRFHNKFFTCPSGKNLQKYLQAYQSSIDVSPNFFSEACNNPESEANRIIVKIAIVQLKEEIIRQLKDWKEEIIIDVKGNTKTFYSGKHGNKPDDICMCFVGGIIMIRKWIFTIRNALATVGKQEITYKF